METTDGPEGPLRDEIERIVPSCTAGSREELTVAVERVATAVADASQGVLRTDLQHVRRC
jgi:hypothetical protein